MNPEEISVFTTLGWNGKQKFFAVKQHMERLRNYANLSGIEYDEDIQKNIIRLLKNTKYNEISEKSKRKFGKPAGLITIRLSNNGSISVVERSNNYNLDCEKINAITISAPDELKKFKGIKFGKHLMYRNALRVAKSNNGNAALIVNNEAVIDGDRGSLMILDENGTAWASSSKYGSIESVTLKLINSKINQKGIPLIFGKITSNMILKAVDAVMVGTGIGVTRINTIDNRCFKFSSSRLIDTITEIFNELYDEEWS